MALDALRCDHLAPLGFKRLNVLLDFYLTFHDHERAGSPKVVLINLLLALCDNHVNSLCCSQLVIKWFK